MVTPSALCPGYRSTLMLAERVDQRIPMASGHALLEQLLEILESFPLAEVGKGVSWPQPKPAGAPSAARRHRRNRPQLRGGGD